MTTQPHKIFTVLVGVDHSEPSAQALTAAIDQARLHERSQLHVVHAIPSPQSVSPTMGVPYVAGVDKAAVAQAAEELRAYVEKVLVTVPSPPHGKPLVERLTTHVGVSHPVEAITQLASDIEADLVVVATHGRRGMARLLLGSVAEGVVRLAPCPVLVVRAVGATDANVPSIEPPCPQCVETRRASQGTEFWCSRHSEHHDRRHTYHLGSAPSGHQSGLLIPTSR